MRVAATLLAITAAALLINIAAAWTYLELHDGPEFPY